MAKLSEIVSLIDEMNKIRATKQQRATSATYRVRLETSIKSLVRVITEISKDLSEEQRVQLTKLLWQHGLEL